MCLTGSPGWESIPGPLKRFTSMGSGQKKNLGGHVVDEIEVVIQGPSIRHRVACRKQKILYTVTKIPFMYPFSGNCATSCIPNFHIHVSVTDLYIPRIGPHFSCSRIGRSIVGIYKSLTDTWEWNFGLWPRNFFSENICFEFSILVLCSVCQVPALHISFSPQSTASIFVDLSVFMLSSRVWNIPGWF